MKAKEDGGDQETIYTNLLHCENQRRSARRLQSILGKTFGSGLTRVSIQDENGSLQEVTDKQGIESACIESNRVKSMQTEDTPPMTSPLVDDLGFDGTSPACQDILRGTYTPLDNIDKYTKEYLQHLQAPPVIQYKPKALITTESYQQLWT